MMKKQPESLNILSKYRIITVVAGFAVFCIMIGLTRFLIARGADSNTIFAVHIVEICLLISGCILFSTALLKSRNDLIKLRENASTDKLTELYNRSYLEPFLEQQIEMANRNKRPVSIIMVDLDHFKEINDNNGHFAGDHVLTIFSKIVLKCIRKTDIIARYGGDEFIVVLPDTDTETARSIAERIRRDVEEAYIPPADGIKLSSISCSVGLSTYPIHCNSKHGLIKTSDQALYEAKRSGRNRTIVYNRDLATF